MEMEEAISRDVKRDSFFFQHLCGEIRDKINAYNLLKQKGEDGLAERKKLKREISMKILDLKKLNRGDKLRHKVILDRLTEVRSKVDMFHWQLQNLLYETNYLQKEISKCSNFRSKIDEIDLITKEEFIATLNNDNEKNSRPDIEMFNERLDYELKERRRLVSVLEEKSKKKEKLANELQQKKRQLENVKPQIENILTTIQSTLAAINHQ